MGLQQAAPAAIWADLCAVYHYLFRACSRGHYPERLFDVLALSGTEAALLYFVNFTFQISLKNAILLTQLQTEEEILV